MNIHGKLHRPLYLSLARRLIGRLATATLLATWLCALPAFGAPGGELDASFGENGRLSLRVEDGRDYYDMGWAIALQPADQKLLLAGHLLQSGQQDFALLRRNVDGSPDDSFGANGSVVIDFAGGDDFGVNLTVQPNGKIIVAGYAGMGISGFDLALVRLNADGTTDATFGNDGRVTLDLGGSFEYVADILLLPNGKIVVSGATDASGNGDIALAQFEQDGSLDTSFGTGTVAGTTIIDANGLSDEPHGLVRQSDGKLLVCGSVVSYPDVFVYSSDMLSVRANADGSVDAGFGINGVSVAAGHRSGAESCLEMPDGKILLAGYQGSDIALARFTSDGASDTTFATSGTSIIDLGGIESVRSMIVSADGSVGITGSIATVREFALGTEYGSPTDMFVASVDTDSGLFVTSFGDDGLTIVDFGQGQNTAWSEGRHLIRQADGKQVALGQAANSSLAIARVDPLGTGNAGFAGFSYTGSTFEAVAEGTPALTVSVRRSGGSTGSLSVDYDTVADTAMAPGDFTATSGTLTWQSGDMDPKFITVPITTDSIAEDDENFAISLTNSTGGLAASEYLATITETVSPAPSSGGGGAADNSRSGGGAIGIEFLVLLAMLAADAVHRRCVCISRLRPVRSTAASSSSNRG